MRASYKTATVWRAESLKFRKALFAEKIENSLQTSVIYRPTYIAKANIHSCMFMVMAQMETREPSGLSNRETISFSNVLNFFLSDCTLRGAKRREKLSTFTCDDKLFTNLKTSFAIQNWRVSAGAVFSVRLSVLLAFLLALDIASMKRLSRERESLWAFGKLSFFASLLKEFWNLSEVLIILN